MKLALIIISIFVATEFAAGQESLRPVLRSSLEFLHDPTPVPDSVANSQEEMKSYEEIIPGTRVRFMMVPIPGGTFLLGSHDDETGRRPDEGPRVKITVEPFWMDEHEVTWEEYQLLGFGYLKALREKQTEPLSVREQLADAISCPSYVAYNIGAISYRKSDKLDHPASGMTHFAAQVYCKWLTALTGRYYRLPTEAEWEYAARAGAQTAYFWGDDPKPLKDYAWFAGNVEIGTGYNAAKTRKPNPFGLYDMYGNVAEWVHGRYDADTYAKIAREDWDDVYDTTANFGIVVRGGSCDDGPEECRSAARSYSVKDWKKQDPQFPQSLAWTTDAPFVGFRVVRPLRIPTEKEIAMFEPFQKVLEKYESQNKPTDFESEPRTK